MRSFNVRGEVLCEKMLVVSGAGVLSLIQEKTVVPIADRPKE